MLGIYWYIGIAYAATIPINIFLILMPLPLYRLAQDRTAIYIVFSKTCFNILEMSLASALAIINNYFTPIMPTKYMILVLDCTIQSALFVIFVHFLAMAINRFHAVFMPFSYMHVWNRRNTHLYILFVSLLGIFIGSTYVVTQPLLGSSLIFLTVQYTVLGVSGAIYSAMIAKFAIELYQSKKGQNAVPTEANVEKNRMLLSLIALLSILPLLFNILISVKQNIYKLEMDMGVFFNCLRIANYALMQCVEEFFLIIFCEDFRTIIRKQYKFLVFWKKKSTTTKEMQITVVGTKIGQERWKIDWAQLSNPLVLALTTRPEDSKITTRRGQRMSTFNEIINYE